MEDAMLTTYDNPFNPFDEFIIWFKYDIILGHNTCGLLAEMAATSPSFSESKNNEITNEAMDYIVSLAPTLYRKVRKYDFKKNYSYSEN